MSAVKHTPTPWNSQESGFRGTMEIFRDNGDSADKAVGKIANVLADELYSKEGFANAKFIVTACNSHEELVEALKKLPLDSFGDDMSKHDAADFVDHAGEFFEAMIAARAALAKAGRP